MLSGSVYWETTDHEGTRDGLACPWCGAKMKLRRVPSAAQAIEGAVLVCARRPDHAIPLDINPSMRHA